MAEPVKTASMDEQSSVPSEVLQRVRRGEMAIRGEEPIWQEALAFFGNDQYVMINAVSNQLDRMERREGGAKPTHRPRLQRNRMTSKVMGMASMLTRRMPAWGVEPPNGDPTSDNQAQLGEKVLYALQRQLKMRTVAIHTVLYAILTGAGFVWPWWDPTIGEYVGEGEDGNGVHQGDIKNTVLHQGEVLWEPGVPFEESDWACVRKAMPTSKVKKMAPEEYKDKITSDAAAGYWERPGNDLGELTFVYEYLEKPCGGKPGRWLRFACREMLRPEKPYPRKKGGDVLHKLPWIPRPDKHRDLGAGEQLVDCQRSYNRGHNQVIQWRTMLLVGQMMAPQGSLIRPLTDRVGEVIEYRLIGGQKPEWRPAMDIPPSLFETMDRALDDMDDILATSQAPDNIESGAGITAWDQSSQARQGSFADMVAEWWEDFGQHLLELVQSGYTERRLLELDGRFGADRVPDFLGRDLGDIGRVTVEARSVAARTREQQEKRILFYAEREWISQHEAMRALEAGTADAIISEIELDEAKQHREIRRMLTLAARVEGETKDPTVQGILDAEDQGRLEPYEMFPMPEEFDNHAVHRHMLRLWMKTRDFELQPELVKEWARAHDEAHAMFEEAEQLAAMEQQAIDAQNLGGANASRQPAQGQPSRPAEDTTAAQAEA